ncbi:MAG: hypothetical protein ACHQAY_24000 [Hyphomicrobiales bacterium]
MIVGSACRVVAGEGQATIHLGSGEHLMKRVQVMRKIKTLLMAILLATLALAEVPQDAFAGVASPVAAAAVASSSGEDSLVAKAAYRYCRYTHYGKICGRWHYGYHRGYRRWHYRRHYLIRYCRRTYYGRVCGRWH